MFTRYKPSRPYNLLEIPFLVNYFDDDDDEDEDENDVGKIFNSVL